LIDTAQKENYVQKNIWQLRMKMNKQEIKERLRKARYANQKETGRKRMTKDEMYMVIKASIQIPQENKVVKVNSGPQSIREILTGFKQQEGT
jgi:hypothetical protein